LKVTKHFDNRRIQKVFQAMQQVTTILGELLRYFPRYEFEKLEQQYQSNRHTKYDSGWHQFVTLLFAQFGGHDRCQTP
jgi:flagellar motor switch protein FliG